MLVDFSVENYRSISEEVTLSAVAQSAAYRQTARPDREIAQTFKVEGRDIELLPVLGVFGANASGKSNVVKAGIRS